MTPKLTFLGAAQNVTGSHYLLELDGTRLLVDCGLFQERDLQGRNWEPLPVPPGDIDAVLLTHAHLDHCGLLPRLARHGFHGRIYATGATAEIASIVMADSAKIQEEDVSYKKKRHEQTGQKPKHPYEPLYSRADADAASALFAHVPFQEPVEVAPGVTAEFFEAGHILGAASIRLTLADGGRNCVLAFSGDIGRNGMPMLRDPLPFERADYVIIESTYGNRTHEATEGIPDQLEALINETHADGGNVVIPSFAVERSQDVLYHLNGLLSQGRIPHTMVMVDSPMAIRVTDVFKHHPELMDQEALALLENGRHPCDFPGLKMCRSVEESKAINHIRGSIIIIAGSGMCTGGRVKHHLVSNIGRPESTVLFVGYQAVGTLGRAIVDGAKEVRIHGHRYEVKAKVRQIEGFSGHADQAELLDWITAMEAKPKRVFVTHGEKDAAETLVGLIADRMDVPVHAPVYGDAVDLDG